jgi:hypothetical protein
MQLGDAIARMGCRQSRGAEQAAQLPLHEDSD